MAKTIIKQTHTVAVVKCAGVTLNDTITLNTDLRMSTQIGGTPRVQITQVIWANSPGANDLLTITRGGTTILVLYQNGEMDFGGNGGFVDNINETSDIVVTSVGTAQVYLTLRKQGYVSTVEPETFGPNDNPAVVGS